MLESTRIEQELEKETARRDEIKDRHNVTAAELQNADDNVGRLERDLQRAREKEKHNFGIFVTFLSLIGAIIGILKYFNFF